MLIMEKLLKNIFYKKFAQGLIFCLIAVIIMIPLIIFSSIDYIQTHTKLWVPILAGIVLFAYLIIVIRQGRLYLFDFWKVKNNAFEKITGIVVRIQEKEIGGDPPTKKYYPIIKDDLSGKEMKLDVNGVKVGVGCKYSFLYLPHTRLAVISDNILDF